METAVVAVGPERGFNEFEIGLLAKSGLVPAALGPRTLRVEDAVPALLSRVAPG